MAYMNPILGAIQNKQKQDIANQQFEANYAMKAQQLGAQMPGWKASADAQVFENNKKLLTQGHQYFRNSGMMDPETFAFKSQEEIMSDPGLMQQLSDFMNMPMNKDLIDPNKTGQTFKGFVPVSSSQAVMELDSPEKTGERTFVSENASTNPSDNPMLMDENTWNIMTQKMVSRMEHASGMLGGFGRKALQEQADKGQGRAEDLVNNSALQLQLPTRQDLNDAAGNPETSMPQQEIPVDQNQVEVPAAFGTEGGLSFDIPKQDPSKIRKGPVKNNYLRSLLRDTGDAAKLSQYSPTELNNLTDPMLQSAAEFHKDAIKDNSVQKIVRQSFGGKGKKQPLTEDQEIAIAQHTAALDQIQGLAASRVAVGNATEQNTMASKATNNAVKNQVATVSMVTDPAKSAALDAAITSDVGTDPKNIEEAVTKAGKTIGGIKPNKKITSKDVYQLSLLKANKVIDQATFNRIIDLGVFSDDTLGLVKTNVDAQVSVLKQQMSDAAKVKADAIKAKALLAADEKGKDGQAFDDMMDLTEQWNENPERVYGNLFAANNSVGGLSVNQNGFLSIKIAEKLNKKLSVGWLSDPWDMLTRGNISPQDQAVGLNSYALKDNNQIVFIDQHGNEKGNADTYLSKFTPDEQKYLKQELGDVARAQIHSVVTKYKDLERRVNDQETDQKLIPELKQQMADLMARAAKLTQTNVQGPS
jgi:hypothetical protein